MWSCGFIDIGCLPAAAYRTPIINRQFSERKSTLKQLLRNRGSRDVPFSVLPALARLALAAAENVADKPSVQRESLVTTAR